MEGFRFTMSAFTEDMIVSATSDPNRRKSWMPPGFLPQNWVVEKELPYAVGSLEHPTEMIIVPKGFVFNGHSVPLGLRWLFPRAHSIYLQAAALHDYLYHDRHWPGTRRKADAIYFEALHEVLGVNRFWAKTMWLGVRVGGWIPWRKARRYKSDGREQLAK
jgi:hypothetical protein